MFRFVCVSGRVCEAKSPEVREDENIMGRRSIGGG
jgi:hypothetical protein